MKPLNRLLGVAVGFAAALCALSASASARNLSVTETVFTGGWSRVNLAGGFGTVECEMVMGGALHARTFAKAARRLIGADLIGPTIPRCARGGASVLRETLPWHIRYESFGGRLPNISSIGTEVIGVSLRIREPAFGVICLARSTEAQPVFVILNLGSGGRLTSASLGGAITTNCGVTGTLSGTSTGVSDLTVTLI